jgi:hypothetical protein
MFLKRFKEKSIQNYLKGVLNAPRSRIHQNKIESVGIILNYDEYNNYDSIRLIFKDLGLKDNRIKFIAFIDDEKSTPNGWDSFFNPKNFGWKGKITNVDLEEFISTKFDALISYYKEDQLELNLVTALSQANFKIGISNRDERLFDFILNIEPQHIQVFQKELVKYLKRLNKI